MARSNPRMKARSQIRTITVVREEPPPQAAPDRLALKTRLGLILVAFGLFTRLSFLTHPPQVIFDEVHFGKFVTAYSATGQRFFDIHPPLAKLLIAASVKLAGYKGGQEFLKIGEPFEKAPPFAFRLVPALDGAALPLVIFIFVLQLGGSLAAAFLVGFAVAFDNSLILQSRVISLDGVLLISEIGALSACLAALKASGRNRILYSILCGILCGLAFGTKFTGLIAPCLVFLVVAADAYRKKKFAGWLPAAQQLTLVGISAAAIYLLGWVIHFHLLTLPGSGDAFYRVNGNFFQDLSTAHTAMLAKNFGLSATHPDASSWWSWPLMLKPIFYWIGGGTSLYLLGNPAVWWPTFILLVALLVNVGLTRITNLRAPDAYSLSDRKLWLPLVGYALSFGPLIGVPRVLFLYHYFTPLLFSLIASVLWMEGLGWTRPELGMKQRRSYWVALGLILAGFYWISPVTYALSMPGFYWQSLPWTLFH